MMAKGTTGETGYTVTVAVAYRLGLAALVAVIVTEVLLVTLLAVKSPLLEILPALADQVTAVFAVPLTLAVKFCCPFEGIVMLLGESEMVILGVGGVGGLGGAGGVGGVLGLLLETTISREVEPDCVQRGSGPLGTGAGRGLSDTRSTDL